MNHEGHKSSIFWHHGVVRHINQVFLISITKSGYLPSAGAPPPTPGAGPASPRPLAAKTEVTNQHLDPVKHTSVRPKQHSRSRAEDRWLSQFDRSTTRNPRGDVGCNRTSKIGGRDRSSSASSQIEN